VAYDENYLKGITCRWNDLASHFSKPLYVFNSHLPYVTGNRDNITILTIYETVWVLKYKETEPLFLGTCLAFLLFIVYLYQKM
jgi:hypothetical protein